ncbi:HAD-IA family hydrolase [Jannaschia pohangensis]|uniref:phosphoglycolate phosphatase n=1 Tax=Jannaschia pohangensis TaxID=390807 RepID=A0A1I3Q8N2_9RHOB|nr:HAD-IA family hydrolase [Jannaschia pohangensis]SFJ29711.1 phosphoglycolate phosphatase [Jannaschia pohangensis]
MKPCVIFDLDGTLCDTSADLLAAANAAFAVLGHRVALDPTATEDRATALRGGRAMLRLGLSRLGQVDEAEVDAGYQPLLDAYARDICRHTTFYPGARDAVARLRGGGYAVGICTNKPEGLARQLMTDLGALSDFHSLIGADTLPVRKPDPAPLHAAIDAAGGDRTRAVLVGDTKTDRDTSANAGLASILVTFAPGGATVADLSPEALLHRYEDLDGIVRDLIG